MQFNPFHKNDPQYKFSSYMKSAQFNYVLKHFITAVILNISFIHWMVSVF